MKGAQRLSRRASGHNCRGTLKLLTIKRDQRTVVLASHGDIGRIGATQCIVGSDFSGSVDQCIIERDDLHMRKRAPRIDHQTGANRIAGQPARSTGDFGQE